MKGEAPSCAAHATVAFEFPDGQGDRRAAGAKQVRQQRVGEPQWNRDAEGANLPPAITDEPEKQKKTC
jgi:hypothetical protein